MTQDTQTLSAHDHGNCELCDQTERELAEAKEWLETERMRLAGCSSAALGYYKRGDSIHPDYKSASLDDVVTLYEKYQQAEQRLTEARRELDVTSNAYENKLQDLVDVNRELAQSEQRLAEAEKDAERYRYLRLRKFGISDEIVDAAIAQGKERLHALQHSEEMENRRR